MSVVYITGKDRRLSSRIEKNDLIKVIGTRMVDIENLAPIYVPFDYDIEKIAVNEIKTKNCPLSLLRIRAIKNGVHIYEVWDLNEIIFDKKDLLG
jgi:hypothetical protein